MKVKSIDVCITTYTTNSKLIQILEILNRQTNKDFNLIINDDGNSNLIDIPKYKIITKYIWNEDFGYHRVARYNESISL